MAITVYKKSAITGGLTAIDGDVLLNGDMAFVELSGIAYIYVLDDSAGSGPGSQVYPSKMIPTANYGTKAWLLQGISVLSLRINNVLVTATAAELNLLHGQVGILTGATGTRAIFYQSAAPSGWTIVPVTADRVLYVGATGGIDNSDATHTWTQPNHVHAGPSHTHGVVVPITGWTTVQDYNDGIEWATGGLFEHRISAERTLTSAAGGTGNTGNGATADTWRPPAHCVIICTKN